jgi:hypothetical protein
MAKGTNKDLALLQMLDEQSLLSLLGQEMSSGGSFVDENRIKLNAKYMNDPNAKAVLDIVYAAVDGGEDAETVVNELMTRMQDPNDTSIPKLNDITQVQDIVGGVLNSSQAKTKSISSGTTGLEVLAKLGVPEFAPLLTKVGATKRFELPNSPYSSPSAVQAKYLADAEKLAGKTAGLKADTTKGAKTDYVEATVPKLDFLKDTPLGYLSFLGGKKLPIGKGLDVLSKATSFVGGAGKGLLTGGLPGALYEGGRQLGEANKTGTGFGQTESQEQVKKRQALALIALKKNQQDIADAQQAAMEEQARQAGLNEMYNAGTAMSSAPRSGNIFDKAAFAQGVYNQQKTTKANNALGPSSYDMTRLLLAKAMRG